MSFQYLNIMKTIIRQILDLYILFQYFIDSEIKNILKDPVKLWSKATET